MRYAIWVVAAASSAALAFPSRALAQTVNISVDAANPGAAIERVWPNYGYDEDNYSTTAEGKALLKALVDAHTAQVHVRTHFLLNTGNGTASLKWGSTNAYTEDAAGNPVYSWTLLDGILDAITGSGARSFTEIAFMPQALSTGPAPYMNSDPYSFASGAFYPPKDYAKWGNLITAWATHVNTRYPDAGTSWLWELWNEPDIDYWHGTFAEYAKLYDTTEAALHGVLPNAPLGGPAVANPSAAFLPQFLDHCATGKNAVTGKTGTRLDLVSFHAKGGAAIVGGHVELNLGNQLRLHRTGFNAVAASAFKQAPIYITEADPDGCAACPASTTPSDAYRNSPAYGAYEVAMMKRTLELGASSNVKVGGLFTWAFTFPGSAYFAGYRVLASNGISLPVLSAFKLLGQLQGSRLPVTSSGAAPLATLLADSVRANADIDAMATLDGKRVQVLVWNYHDDLVTAPAAPVQLAITVPASFGTSATVTHARVDETHGDAYTVWKAQGSPAKPSATQITALQQAMDPAPLTAPQTLAVEGGSVHVSFDLPRFGISLVTLTPTEPDPNGSGGAGAGSAAGAAGAAADGGSAGASAGGVAPANGGSSAADAGGGSGGTVNSQGGSSAPPSAGAPSAGLAPTPPPKTPSDGCSCALARARDDGPQLFGLFALALFGTLRRAYQRRRAPPRDA